MTYIEKLHARLDFIEHKEVLIDESSFGIFKTENFLYVINFIQGENYTSLSIINDDKEVDKLGEFTSLDNLVQKICNFYYNYDCI
jgi:hypothetical protein